MSDNQGNMAEEDPNSILDTDLYKEVTFDQKVSMKSVTQDGNIYNPSGTLSGGSKPSTSGILIKVLELKKVEGLLKDHQSKLESKMSLFNQTTKATKSLFWRIKMLNELKKLIIDLKNKQKAPDISKKKSDINKSSTTVKIMQKELQGIEMETAEETDQVVELAREEHEAQRQIRQLQPPDPKVPKETRPIEDPMTPGLEGNQGEGAAVTNTFRFS
ncbi:hypothetical protein BY996DRAFT_6457611 [Phakopsora pachyrhizi]|nr:hypothetical protein BY996DRAFT_6457611 [Phakopsora pachyrhizi]